MPSACPHAGHEVGDAAHSGSLLIQGDNLESSNGLTMMLPRLRAVSKEIESSLIGRLRAARSGVRSTFAMLLKLDGGMGVAQQLDKAIRKTA